MKIFEWEQALIDFMRTWPRSGPIYDIMDFISDFATTKWIVLIVLVIIAIRYGWRKLVKPLLISLVAVGLADLLAHRSVQDFFKRPRPNFLDPSCNTSQCWGFVSSHAANTFAVVAVLYCFNKQSLRWSLPLATIICFSRVYLTSHYPLDVLCGAAAGLMVGFFIVYVYDEIASRMGKDSHSVDP